MQGENRYELWPPGRDCFLEDASGENTANFRWEASEPRAEIQASEPRAEIQASEPRAEIQA